MSVEEAKENLKNSFMRDFNATEDEALAMVGLVEAIVKGKDDK